MVVAELVPKRQLPPLFPDIFILYLCSSFFRHSADIVAASPDDWRYPHQGIPPWNTTNETKQRRNVIVRNTTGYYQIDPARFPGPGSTPDCLNATTLIACLANHSTAEECGCANGNDGTRMHTCTHDCVCIRDCVHTMPFAFTFGGIIFVCAQEYDILGKTWILLHADVNSCGEIANGATIHKLTSKAWQSCRVRFGKWDSLGGRIQTKADAKWQTATPPL